ncbi:MAG: hypothetical protein ACQER1_15755 [Armatimonadota bacterium]
MMSVTKAVLCVGRSAGPHWPVQQRQSCALLPLGRKSVLQVLFEEIVAAGAHQICLLINRNDQSVSQYVKSLAIDDHSVGVNGQAWTDSATDVTVECIEYEHEPGLLMARRFVGNEPFMCATTEMPIYHRRRSGSLLSRMSAAFEATGADGVLAVNEGARSSPASNTLIEAVGDPGASPHFVVADLVDSPLSSGRPINEVLVSRFVLSPIVFDYLDENGAPSEDECDLIAALRRLAHDRESLWAVRTQSGEVPFDLSSFLLYSRTFIHFSLEDPEVGTAIREYISSLATN